jgi:hypothetical protein
MNKGALTAITALCALIVQTNAVELLLPAWLRPDLMIGVAVWAGLRLDTVGALCFAFLSGCAMELYSGTPTGLLAVCYTITAAACSRAEALLRFDRLIAVPVFATLGALLIGAVTLAAQWINQSGVETAVLLHVPVKAVMTGAAAAAMATILDRMGT